MKKSLITSIFSQHLKTFTKYLKNLWKRDINDSVDLWNSLWSKNLHSNGPCCLHKTDAPFQNIISNVCCESSFAYIMVRNLESNFLKIFNQSEDRNRSGRKRKDGRQSKWNTNKYWKWSDLEAQRKGSCSWFFMMVSTFCISIILEEFARSFGESYLKNC